MSSVTERPDPDRLLAQVNAEAARERSGRLKIWLGAAPGVGKTFAMLGHAQRLRAQGVDVVVGVIETHGRQDTARLLAGLEVLPPRVVAYRGTSLREFDLAAALARRPRLLLVDELAHSNAPGSRFEKRWQDVRALLDAGIDVHTTLNIQHVESLIDVVARLTGVTVRETVPDAVLEDADEIELVDLAPATLLERLRAGKVYLPEAARAAAEAFFRRGNLDALRELALRKTAQLVDRRRRDDRHGAGARRVRAAHERLLVCVGPSPFSARLVRAAHRMAAVVHGELFALHVGPARGRSLAAADQERVLQNLRIAESLGARVASIEAEEPAAAVVAFAEAHQVSRIVVGKTRRSRLHEAWAGSFTMAVIRGSRDMDVYVIDGEPEEGGRRETVEPAAAPTDWRLAFPAPLTAVAVTAAAIAAAVGLSQPPDLSVPALLLVLGVVAVAVRCGRWSAVAAAVISSLAFNFLLTEPRYSFRIAEPAYLFAFVVMLVVGLMLSHLVATVREREIRAREREVEVSTLHSLARALADAQTVEDVGRAVVAHLRDVVRADLALLIADPGRPPDLASVVATHGPVDWLGAEELAVARWCWEHGAAAGAGTANLPGTAAQFVPLRSARGKEGVLGLRLSAAAPVPTAKQRLLLETIAEQTAVACERLALVDERQRERREAETERLRSTLLASVSHDLRTPLATITGAASTLLDDPPADPDVRRELLHGIATEAGRLNELVANLLFATRLDAGAVGLRRDWASVEEIVGSALRRVGEPVAGRPLAVEVARPLPLLHVDPVLLEQALFLLLENAVRHTPAGTAIRVRAFADGADVVIEVADAGPGIPAADRERVFRRFERGERSSGMGLGLPIGAAILRAHGGGLVLLPTATGTVFQMRLPWPKQQPVIDRREEPTDGGGA